MTRVFLIRHGMNDAVGSYLAGRTPGVHLNTQGRAEAQTLAERLADKGIAKIYSSPMERAKQTAAPLAERLGLQTEVRHRLVEVLYGEWTGKTMQQMETDPAWRRWNTARSLTRPPEGEMMVEIQARMIAEMEVIHRENPDATVAVFSHGDPIRATIAYYLGIPLDLSLRLEVGTASVTTLLVGDDWVQVSFD